MASESIPVASDQGKKPPKLEQDALDRLGAARRMKAKHELDIREGYFFTAPRRSRSISSLASSTSYRPADEGELQISIAMEEAETFTTTLINSFMPQGVPWADLSPATAVPEVMKDQLAAEIKTRQDATFDLINESNFYSELATTLNPDGAIGTFALWIDRGRFHQAVTVKGVPLRELEINVGPDGKIDDRFVVRHTKNKLIKAILGATTKLTPQVEKAIKDEPESPATVVWGFWRLWDIEDQVSWQSVLLVNDKLQPAAGGRLDGHGSCPLIPVTFNRHIEFAYGEGPTIKALPELRVLDDMAAGEVENVDVALHPPMGFPDDSFANLGDGIEPSHWYPIRPGTENAIKKLIEPNPMDAVYFEQKQREERVRRLHYNDFPQQRGDTPPTATQWVDEMAMAQRKIGTPGLRFWDEGPAEFFMRFYWLAAQSGASGINATLKVNDKAIALVPDNPTKRAQDQQKVAMLVRGIQIVAGSFPEEFKAGYDGVATADNVFKKLGVADMIPKRSADQVNNAVNMISKLSAAGANAGHMPTVQPGQIGGPALPPPQGGGQ